MNKGNESMAIDLEENHLVVKTRAGDTFENAKEFNQFELFEKVVLPHLPQVETIWVKTAPPGCYAAIRDTKSGLAKYLTIVAFAMVKEGSKQYFEGYTLPQGYPATRLPNFLHFVSENRYGR